MNSLPISVIIPSWNGAALLRQFLPLVLQELKQHPAESECIVVDDGSTDDSIELLENEFPVVRVVHHQENRGFSSCANSGIARSTHEHVLLLNNDVGVTPGF